MSTTTITFPSDLSNRVLASASDTIGQLGPLIAIIVGVLLAVLVIGLLIDHFRK